MGESNTLAVIFFNLFVVLSVSRLISEAVALMFCMGLLCAWKRTTILYYYAIILHYTIMFDTSRS